MKNKISIIIEDYIKKYVGVHKMAAPVIISAFVVVCAIAIPISVKFLGKNNIVEQVSEEILEDSANIILDSLDGELGNDHYFDEIEDYNEDKNTHMACKTINNKPC